MNLQNGYNAAAHPFWEWIWDLYKCLGDFVCRCLGFYVLFVISCFETATQHISGQPFCNMSMDALDVMVNQAINLVFCRPAQSGEVVHSSFEQFVCFSMGSSYEALMPQPLCLDQAWTRPRSACLGMPRRMPMHALEQHGAV